MTRALFVTVAAVAVLFGAALAQQPPIYWGNEVPAGWTGSWSADLQTL